MRTGNYQSCFLDSLLLALDTYAKLHAYNIVIFIFCRKMSHSMGLNRPALYGGRLKRLKCGLWRQTVCSAQSSSDLG